MDTFRNDKDENYIHILNYDNVSPQDVELQIGQKLDAYLRRSCQKTLSEIAWKMGYSSVAHPSGQFKRISGFSPSYFKR